MNRLLSNWIQRSKQLFLPDIAEPSRTLFFTELSFQNFSRAVLLSAVLVLSHLLLIALNFSERYQNGIWQSAGYERLAYLHFILVGTLSLFLLVAYFIRHHLHATSLRYWLSFAFSSFMMLWCAALSSSDQEIHGQITVYIVALFGLAVAQLYPLWESLVLYGVPHLVLLFGIAHFQANPETTSAHYVNSSVSALVAWIISRLLYANWVKDFQAREKEKALLQQLADQTERLKAEKQQSDRLLRELSEASWELALTNESLREANKFKSEILEIAAHDLKNPLQSIIGFTSLIAESPSLPHIKEMNQVIRRSAERMAAIIQEVLESAIVESNLSQLSKATINFSVLVEHILQRFVEQAHLKQQTFYTELEPNCFAEVDVRHIRSVLENLLSNAMKYSYPGTRIWVRLEKRHDFRLPQGSEAFHRSVTFSSNDSSSPPASATLLFSVKDEGQGLTEEDMTKLFGKFQRLSALPTGGESSTGLGLYLAKQIVVAHGGKIWAESAGKGKGATFFVALPAASALPE